MEKVKKFDEQLRREYDYEFMMSNFLCILLSVLGILCMFIPIEGIIDSELRAVYFMMLILMCFATKMYMHPYMMIPEKGKAMSIYEKLKWMPVSKKEIQAVRMEYLNRYSVKILTGCVVAQQIGAIISGEWSVWSLLFPIVFSFVMWLVGAGDVYITK